MWWLHECLNGLMRFFSDPSMAQSQKQVLRGQMLPGEVLGITYIILLSFNSFWLLRRISFPDNCTLCLPVEVKLLENVSKVMCLFQIMCEPDARNCWVVSDYTVNIVYRASIFYCLPPFQLQFYWMRRTSCLKDCVRGWVSLWRASEWLCRGEGIVF